MKKYDFKKIEAKWQKEWQEKGVYEPSFKSSKKRLPFYNLMMFPYPSAEGLHVGNMYAFTGTDIYGRYKRMQGYDVFEPIGLDGFGIHSENYAMKIGAHPMKQAKVSEKRFYKQLQAIGNGFSWNERLETYDPEYYRWTQWIFAQMFKAGLVYRKKQAVNWCPSCMTVLSDEQAEGGKCERCNSVVIKKDLEQWFFKITEYAERLLQNLDKLDWSLKVKIAQKNWIGKSEGAELEFPVARADSAKRIIILHGRNGSPDNYAFPWLKRELEKRGYEVDVPKLPNTNEPNDEEQADYVQKHCKLDGKTAIVGVSFGGIVAMRLLERGHKVQRVVLACVPFSGNFGDHKTRKSITEACRKGFAFSKIKKNAERFVVVRDERDEIVPAQDAESWHKNLGGEFLKGYGNVPHFSDAEEPDLLMAISPTVRVFTTRPDTLFGATYLVLSPEHPLIGELELRIKNWNEVQEYIRKARKKTDEERVENKEKTGVEIKGVKAINPATKEEIPIWIADYVLSSYGTGAIMAVPAHDERDYEFAKKHKLPIAQVIAPEFGTKRKEEKRRDGGWGVVFDPRTQKYAVAKWSNGGFGFFGGGFEDGEDMEKGILREVEEESGLYGFSRTEKIGTVWTHYYNIPKKVNRVALATCLLLVHDGSEKKPKLEEHEQFELKWASADEILDNLRKHNVDSDRDHWIDFFCRAVGRAIELKLDKASDSNVFKTGPITTNGILINSDKFNGLDSEAAKWKITAEVGGKRKIQYRLRDWLISRQRYWGPPIPMIHCEVCEKAGKGERKEMPGWYAVPEKDLPVKLPFVKDFRPQGSGSSPLAASKAFSDVRCPVCKNKAKRETDVSDTFLDSAWYYLGYLLPFRNSKLGFRNSPISERIKNWCPVDMYIGGAEHSVLHLLYVRFLALALHDLKLVNFGDSKAPKGEPFPKFRAHGLLIKEGAKMSKSKGNVVNPDEYIKNFGADTLRMYLMFLAPFEQGGDFRDAGVLGVSRFLERVWKFRNNNNFSKKEDSSITRALHQTIKKVSDDVESLSYNTAISAMMILLNKFEEKPELISLQNWIDFLKLLAPFAPHLSEELFQQAQNRNSQFIIRNSIHLSDWPKYNPELAKESGFTLIVQINGKVRASIEAPMGISEKNALALALQNERVKEFVSGTPKRVIFVPNRLINLVI